MRLGAGCALTSDTAAENPISNTIGVVGRTHQCPTPITRGGLPSISAQGNDCLQNGLQGKHVEGVVHNSRFRRRVIRSAYFAPDTSFCPRSTVIRLLCQSATS